MSCYKSLGDIVFYSDKGILFIDWSTDSSIGCNYSTRTISYQLCMSGVLRGDSFALTYVGESTRYGVVEDVLDHEVSEYVNENKKF